VLAVGGTAQHQGRTKESGGVSCKSANEAVSVTARQLIEAIQDGMAAYVQVVAFL
jgi:hypothetical protein